MENIIEGIQKEVKRIREHVIPAYEQIGRSGILGLIVIRSAVDRAEKSIGSGDVVAMLSSYKELEEIED